MLEVEPDIWLVLVVSKAWVGQGCSNETMQSSLAALHSLFTLLHGPMSLMLDQVLGRGGVGSVGQRISLGTGLPALLGFRKVVSGGRDVPFQRLVEQHQNDACGTDTLNLWYYIGL